MTEIEEKFMQVFGIKPITNGCGEYYYVPDETPCKECEDKICLKDFRYSKITDSVLLELLVILIEHTLFIPTSWTVAELRNEILERCIKIMNGTPINSAFARKIKALFE